MVNIQQFFNHRVKLGEYTMAVMIVSQIVIMATLTILSWNMRSFSCATPYIQDLMNTADILMLSEHRLYESEHYKIEELSKDYSFLSKSSEDLSKHQVTRVPGHCGITLCWKKTINHKIQPINVKSDRIAMIRVNNCIGNESLYVIGVYLPQQGCKIASFDEQLAILEQCIEKYKDKGYVIALRRVRCHAFLHILLSQKS